MQYLCRLSQAILEVITSGQKEEKTGSKKQGTEIGGGGRSPQEGAKISCCIGVGMANAGTPTLIH